jgi:Rieske Fe-S protein
MTMTDSKHPESNSDSAASTDRRNFLTTFSTAAMTAGLAGGYGGFALIAGRFLYPAQPVERRWQFVTVTDRLREGESLLYRAPSGETINVTRQGRNGDASDFIALSSTCPHLGCQVHWQAQHNRFFCPCHNGTFDAQGRGTGGPPGEAGQSLPQYPIRVEEGRLFIEVPVETLASADGDPRDGDPRAGDGADATEERVAGGVIDGVEGICGPGHDPCLTSLPGERRFGGGRSRKG